MLSRVVGEIDDGDLAQQVIALNQAVKGVVGLRELADCRGITEINLSTGGTTASAKNEQDKPGSRLAILVPEGNDLVFGMARAYQMFSESFREAVHIFYDLDEALLWLANNNGAEHKVLSSHVAEIS